MQYEIKTRTPLLDDNGHLAVRGYATQMNVAYNRDKAKGFPLKLKEWDFYQIQKDHWVLQLTLGHVSYISSVSATLFHIDTGERYEFGTMKPLYIPELDLDPEEESQVSFQDKDYSMTFTVTKNRRILDVQGCNQKYKKVAIHIALDYDRANEKMVIATPFSKPAQFYLNYKENYYHGTGSVQFDDVIIDFDGCTGLIDWGRGIWPYRHQWFWGNLTSRIDGVPFGFNIGWGFGDLSRATENMFFYDRKAYKLGVLQVEWDESDYMKPWHLADPEGKLDMTFTPLFDNYTQNKYVVVDTHCNQVFGLFTGTIQTVEGPKKFENLLAFIEHAVNRW